MTQRDVNVIFVCNEAYAILLGVALCSLFENKKGNYPVNVYVVDTGISAKSKERFSILEKRYGFAITYVVPDKKLFEQLPYGDLIKGYYAPIEVYHRVYLSHVVPSTCHKLIDLDDDMVIRGDIAELYDIDLEGKTLGGVADCDQKMKWELLGQLRANIEWPSLPKDPVYFNSGMMLVDMDRWRERNVEEKLVKLIQAHPTKLWHHDQDALNAVLLEDHKDLPLKYNFLVGQFDAKDAPDPFILHFVGGAKPWYRFSAVPYQSEYLYYVNKTPWKDEKYRKIMDVYFAKKYHFYTLAWGARSAYKKIRGIS